MRTTVALAGIVATGCFADSPDSTPRADDEANRILESLREDGYREWEAPPTSADLPRRRRAVGPHGAWVEVYLAPALLEAFFGDDELEAWPAGVAAVCESYDSEDAVEPFLINVMRRDDEGWAWGQVDADDIALTPSRPDDCIGCHGAAEDFVFSLFLPRG